MSDSGQKGSGGSGDRRVLQLIGLARRAGHAVVGTDAVRVAGRRGELSAVVVAGDATQNARKRLYTLLSDPDVSTVTCGTRATLGRAVGRTEAVVVGIRDQGLGLRVAAVQQGSRTVNASSEPAYSGDGKTDRD